MGVIGGLIILRWSQGLISETSGVLLDHSIDLDYKTAIKAALENDADNRVADLHIWRVSANHFAIIVTLVSHQPQSPEHYKALLANFSKLAHITIEVHQCHDC
jgi:Co/Zn/Cd efflux system component